jgi:catalase (peroxidase I)
MFTRAPVAMSHSRSKASARGAADANAKLVTDFVAACSKVMNLDRFDLA